MILADAARMGRHFGRELVFTYGPLGWLENRVQLPALLGAQLAWQAVTRALVVWMLARVLGGGGRFIAVAIAISALCSTPSFLPMADAYYFVVVWLSGIVLVREAEYRGGVTYVAGALLVGFALVKFTITIAAGGVVVIAAVSHFSRGQRRRGIGLVSGCVAAWLIGWIAAGQSVADVPAFFSGSWAIASSYAAAMTRDLYYPARLVYASVAALMLLALAVRDVDRGGWAKGLLTVWLLALVWRHGVSRPDSYHLSNVFVWLTVVSLSWPGNWRVPAIGSAIALSAWCISYSVPYLWRVKSGDATVVYGRAAAAAVSPVRTYAEFRRSFETAIDRAALVRVRAAVGDAVVDVHGFNQQPAIMTGLRYVPRPIPQSYSAYDRYLSGLNLAWLQQVQPRFSLVQIATIDDRLPTLDDGPCLAWLLQHDVLRAEEDGFVVLEHRALDILRARKTETETEVEFGRWYDVAGTAAEMTYVQLFPKATFSGRLLQGIVPAAVLSIEVKTTRGAVERYRLPAPLAESGFLAAPFIRSNDDLRVWFRDPEASSRIVAFRLTTPGAHWFAPRMQMRTTSYLDR